MARNAEKANLMLNKWTSLKSASTAASLGLDKGGGREKRRPFLASECKALPEAERAALAAAGRAHARAEFSDERFQMGVYRTLLPLVRDGLDAARERRRADTEARKRGERSGF